MAKLVRVVAVVGAVFVGTSTAAAAQRPVVYRIPVTGTIELGIAPFVARSLQEAEAAGARAAILDLNTPGGRVDAAVQIVDAITAATVPVYALAGPWALSAGAMIALAADSIFMTAEAILGAATPVTGQGEKGSEKIVSAMRAQFRALAERRGLDPKVAEAMVDESVAVADVVDAGKLLTLTTSEAVRLGYAIPTEGWAGVLGALDLADAEVVTSSVNWAEQLVRLLSHPVVSGFLLTIGMLGIMIEIKTPSFGVAGLTGLLRFGAFFGSNFIVGLAGMEEVILLLAGMVLIALEVFVIPGFGLAGLTGLLCVGASIYLSLLSNLSTWGDFTIAAAVLASAALVVGGVVYYLAQRLPSSGRARGVFLTTATSKETGYIAAEPRDELIGEIGLALTDLHPSGTIAIGDERLDVVSEGGYIGKGMQVQILRSDGYRHIVRALDELPSG